MKRIAPSQQIEQELQALLQDGLKTSEQPVSELIKLVFATLWQASQRWQNVSMSLAERQQLNHLRRQLELDPVEVSIAHSDPVEAVA
jgi:hypothetical protein